MKQLPIYLCLISAFIASAIIYRYEAPQNYTSSADHFTARFPGHVSFNQSPISVLKDSPTVTQNNYSWRSIELHRLPNGSLNQAYYFVSVAPFKGGSSTTTLADATLTAGTSLLRATGVQPVITTIASGNRNGHPYTLSTVTNKPYDTSLKLMVVLTQDHLYRAGCERLSGAYDPKSCQTLLDSLNITN